MITMPCWYYDQKAFRKTPSIQDGIDYETECKYRKEGARFIMDIGTRMDLGCNTMATGVVFFHRFYMFQSFMEFPRFVTACCCIFLAGKVEETPKKCKDIIKIAQTILSEEAFSSFGESPKEEVMTLEKILLQTMKFDLKVEHPYCYLIKYAKHLKGDKNKLQKMVQMAWTFINDSLCTTLSLQWEPELIAIALIYLAGKLSKFKVVNWFNRRSYHTKWWDMFVEDLDMSILEDICHQVLDLYSNVKHEPKELQPTPAQTIKNDPEIKLENPVKIDTQQIEVKTEENNLRCTDPRKAMEVYSNLNPMKLPAPIDSILPVSSIKKEPESTQVHDQHISTVKLNVAAWASVAASAVMSPGTSSINSPSFPTPKFLVSPVSVESLNNRIDASTNHQNINFNKNLPANCQESKLFSATSFNNQNSDNFNDVTGHVSQINKLRNSVSLDNCIDNLSTSSRGFDIYSDNLPTSNRGFGNSNDKVPFRRRGFGDCNDNAPFRSRGFGDGNDNAPFRSRGFGDGNDNASFRSRGFGDGNDNAHFRSRGFDNNNGNVPYRTKGFDNINENSSDNNQNFGFDDFSKNYQSCDTIIQDYPDSKDLYNKFKYSTKMRNDKDRRLNSSDYPYTNDMNKNFQRNRSKRSGGRFKNSKCFDEPMNN